MQVVNQTTIDQTTIGRTTLEAGPAGRLEYVDIAKGIGIVLVVYGHVVRGLMSASIAPEGGLLSMIDYCIYAAHMPLFFVLSGMFFAHSHAKGPAAFWKSRLLSIVYPYILWSLLHGSVQAALSSSGAVNTEMTWGRLTQILWAPISPFWFLYALFFANVLMALAARVRVEITVACALIAFLALYQLVGPGPLWDVSYGFLYFAAGVAVSRYQLTARIPASLAWIALALAVYLGLSIAADLAGVPERLAVFATIAGVIALMALSMAISQSAVTRLRSTLAVLGECSISIYVMHILVAVFLRVILVRILGVHSVPLLILLLTFGAVVIPCAVHLLSIRLGVNGLLGFSSTARLRALAGSTSGRPPKPA